MAIFDFPDYDNHEQVLFISDQETGLRGIIAIHDTTLGPALGGCRMWNYQSEEEGLRDVLRLSKGMTYKGAMANVPLGGGKCVILGNQATQKSPALMRALGKIIDRMNGIYITGPDIGTGVEDMTVIHESTRYVIGVAKASGGYGDPSFSTSRGVYQAIRAGITHKFGSPDLKSAKVAVQGLGHVGYKLCELLHQEGAELWVADINQAKLEAAQNEFNATVTEVDQVYEAEVDVFAPCAFGAVVNDETIEQFKASVIAGGANNQLDEYRHGMALKERGIVYVPDYVSNGGGLIQVAAEWFKEPFEEFQPKVDAIYETCLNILQKADELNISTNEASDTMAEERIRKSQPSEPITNGAGM